MTMTLNQRRKEKLSVLSLNIFLRPEGIHSGKWFREGDHKDLRLSLLINKIKEFDLVFLQEMFEIGSRQKRLLKAAHLLGFLYHCGSVWPKMTDDKLIDGGLLILSRFPITERAQFAYTQGSGSDGVCSKGVLYARIQLSTDPKDAIHTFTTHTQAGDGKLECGIRDAQIEEFALFVSQQVAKAPELPVIMTGDFNLDARHDLSHDRTTGALTSTPCIESERYKALVTLLRKALDRGCQLEDLMKKYDTNKLNKDLHTVTNGSGHGKLYHTIDDTTKAKEGKCIDYIFYISAPEKKQKLFDLEVVPSMTHVDQCIVPPLLANTFNFPITHLSDHYGLCAEFHFHHLHHTEEITELSNLETKTPWHEQLQLHFPHQTLLQKTMPWWRWKIWIILSTGALLVAFVVSTLLSMFFISSS